MSIQVPVQSTRWVDVGEKRGGVKPKLGRNYDKLHKVKSEDHKE